MAETYTVRRYCFDSTNENNHRVIATGLTLEAAQAHCTDESTHGDDAEHGGPWFDGYMREDHSWLTHTTN